MIHGVDLSKWQSKPVDYSAIGDFAYVRTSYATTEDRLWLRHVEGLRAAGKAVGGYHFFVQERTAHEQAATFFAQLDAGRIGPGDLLPVIDLETEVGKTIDPQLYSDRAKALCEAVWLRYGGCMIYSTPYFGDYLGSYGAWLRNYPRWVSDYGRSNADLTDLDAPRMPPGLDWVIWQTTGVGRIDAYDGAVDLNVARWLPRIYETTETQNRLSLALLNAGKIALQGPEGFTERKTQ